MENLKKNAIPIALVLAAFLLGILVVINLPNEPDPEPLPPQIEQPDDPAITDEPTVVEPINPPLNDRGEAKP